MQASMLDSLPLHGDVTFIRITHEPKRSLHTLTSDHFADTDMVVIIANGRESEASDLVATAAFAARAAHAYVLVLYMGNENRQENTGIRRIKEAAHAVALLPLNVQASAVRHIINAYVAIGANKKRLALDAPVGTDFVDLRAVFDGNDYTSVSVTCATGKNRAKDAATAAVEQIATELKSRRRVAGFFMIVAVDGAMMLAEIGVAIATASKAFGANVPGEIAAHYDESMEPNTTRVTLITASVEHV
ncbi:hypothetical protein DIE20_11575 [Burkholderia sp. Bp9131]|nr:hypothetical protein DIE20_11575 [Burkholderia sp. Bp9131]